MALSGTIYTNVSSHWRLQLEWTATQSITGNYSTVTAKLYWIALDSYGAVYSSATKTCGIQFNSGSWITTSAAGMAQLDPNEKKLIQTATTTIYHNADGTGSFSVDGYFDAQVTLNGTYYGTINLTETTFTLDTIPRASTLTSSASWTAGNNLPISINRYSSSFTHTVKIYVNNTLIKTLTGVGTTATASFTTTENTNIFTQLAQSSSKSTKITVETYSGGTLIGSNDYTGTCTAPNASTTNAPASFNIGGSFSVSITSANSSFTHTIKLKNGGTVYKTYSNQGTSMTFDTSDIASTLYNATPNSNTLNLTLECTTYYNGVQVRTPTTESITANVTNSNPTFGSGFTYRDSNSTTVAITGNDQYIIQNYSTVTVDIPTSAKATAVNGATMVQYVATLNGKTITQPYSSSATVSFNFGTVNATSNLTLTVKAVDSRGNSTTVTKTVNVLPYSPPVVVTSATRANNFDVQTTLKLSGSISLLNVAGTNKNSIQSIQYHYKDSSSGTWGSWNNFSYSMNGANYTASDVVLNLDNLKAWNIEVKVTDKLTTTTIALTVPIGQPIVFIDTAKKSVGINQFPTNSGTFEVTGSVYLTPSSSGAQIASIFTANTYKTYINFVAATGSNDPGFIMHETSSDSANINKGVLHLCPSDDNDNTNDYVTIHGTNDPEAIKLYTGGNIYTIGDITANSATLDYLVVAGGEVTASSTNIGIMVGSNSGYNVKIDSDEVSAFNNGSASYLHLNPDGSIVTVGNTTGGEFFVRNVMRISDVDLSTTIAGNATSLLRFVATGGYGYIQTGKSSSDTNAILRITRTSTTGTNIAQFLIYSDYSTFYGDVNIANNALIFSDGGSTNIDHIWWDDNNGTYHFVNDGTYKSTGNAVLKASSFTTTSDRELKTNIKDFSETFSERAIDKIRRTKVRTYNYKHDLETKLKGRNAPDIRVGLIADEAPKEIRGVDGTSIDLYAMISFTWQAIQELHEQIEYLQEKLKKR
jgi:hypothetical protein